MNKQKLLLIEYTAHFRNALDNFRIFEKFYDCYFLTTKKNKNKINLINKKITFRFPQFLILFYVIFNGFKFKYIYFSTPHEYPDYPNTLIQKIYFIYTFILYLIIFLIYKKKIIFQLRSLHRYFPNISSVHKKRIFYSRLRNFYLQKCENIICESEYLKKKFINMFGKKNCLNKKILVIYYAYSRRKVKIKMKFNKKKINIGILGTVDKNRKDYSILTKVLEHKFFLYKKISLTFLGSLNTKFSKDKIKEFSKFSKNIITKKYFTEKEFQKFGKKCTFLISLNNKTNFYGKYRMSGCFGDAIILKKYLYCPSFEDPIREFSNFTFYYKNFKSMIKNIILYTKKSKTVAFDSHKYERTLKNIKNNF
jgi:hypothetical protein